MHVRWLPLFHFDSCKVLILGKSLDPNECPNVPHELMDTVEARDCVAVNARGFTTRGNLSDPAEEPKAAHELIELQAELWALVLFKDSYAVP